MAFRETCFGIAGAMAALIVAAPSGAHAGPLAGPVRLHSAATEAKAAAETGLPADGAAAGLPDAPDFDTIPFFAARDNAAYLRVDAGFGALTAGNALTANGRFNPNLSGPVIVGLGVGYKLGFVLRADVTAEYRSRADVETADGIRARIEGANVLANLYADIGTWYGVTPYVSAGAGVGWSRLSGAGPFGGARDRAGLAWAVGGGFAVEVTPAVTVDVGYRYLHTGTVRSPALVLRDSGAHDLRIGLRWRFGQSGADDADAFAAP